MGAGAGGGTGCGWLEESSMRPVSGPSALERAPMRKRVASSRILSCRRAWAVASMAARRGAVTRQDLENMTSW